MFLLVEHYEGWYEVGAVAATKRLEACMSAPSTNRLFLNTMVPIIVVSPTITSSPEAGSQDLAEKLFHYWVSWIKSEYVAGAE